MVPMLEFRPLLLTRFSPQHATYLDLASSGEFLLFFFIYSFVSRRKRSEEREEQRQGPRSSNFCFKLLETLEWNLSHF